MLETIYVPAEQKSPMPLTPGHIAAIASIRCVCLLMAGYNNNNIITLWL
jgi:hypothetical protein